MKLLSRSTCKRVQEKKRSAAKVAEIDVESLVTKGTITLVTESISRASTHALNNV